MERKTDLRIIKTKKAIKTAFLNLLKENKYHNITISAISETALINRKTFYAHYETKDELYADVIEDALRVLSPANVLNEIGTVETEKKKKEFIYQTLLNWKKNCCHCNTNIDHFVFCSAFRKFRWNFSTKTYGTIITNCNF